MVRIKQQVHYYETDKMGVVHHSNYIRWMEDARLAWLDEIGMPYAAAEARGVVCPVVAVDCQYKKPTFFGDTVEIEIHCTMYNGIRLNYAYTIRDGLGDVVATGSSRHCFQQVNSVRPVQVAQKWPDLNVYLMRAAEADRLEQEGLPK